MDDEKTSIDDEKTFSDFLDRMKRATKGVHDVQDLAINGLFVISLYAGGAAELWFQALSRFEIVFAELEDALEHVTLLQSFDIPGIRIAHVIKSDLDEFYGVDRKLNSPAINRWISEVRKTREEDPRLVAAYIYHMYLGLYSGGRILRKKFKLPGQTLDLDDRSTNLKQSLKKAMKDLLLSHPDIEDGLILHSENLFKMNNVIIQECNLQQTRLFKIVCSVGVVSAFCLFVYNYYI